MHPESTSTTTSTPVIETNRSTDTWYRAFKYAFFAQLLPGLHSMMDMLFRYAADDKIIVLFIMYFIIPIILGACFRSWRVGVACWFLACLPTLLRYAYFSMLMMSD